MKGGSRVRSRTRAAPRRSRSWNSPSPERMKTSRFLADYGMIFVLLLLCAFFSVVTYSEQSPTGEAAAKQVVTSIRQQFGATPRVLIAASDQPGDAAFAAGIA